MKSENLRRRVNRLAIYSRQIGTEVSLIGQSSGVRGFTLLKGVRALLPAPVPEAKRQMHYVAQELPGLSATYGKERTNADDSLFVR